MDTPRPLDEVRNDAKKALEARDTPLMRTYAAELRTLPLPEAVAYADYFEGVACLYSGDPQTAIERFSSTLAAATELNLLHLVGAVEAAHGQALMTYGRYSESLERLDAAVAAFASLPVDRASMTARRARSTVLRMIGAFAEAYETSMTVLDLARSVGDLVMEAQCLYDLGTLHMMTGDLPRAFATLYAALDLYEQHGNLSDVASTLGQLGATYAQLQEVDRGREMFLRAADIYTALNEPYGLIDTYGNLGITHLNAGSFDHARTYLERAVQTAESIGADHHRTFFVEALATSLQGLGESDAALALLDREAENFRKYPDIAISSNVTRSKILIAQGQADEANTLLLADLAAVESDPRTDLRIYVRDALRAVARARGDFDAYLEHDAVYNSMNEELRGKATSQKVMVQEKERELAAIRQTHDRHLAVLYSALPKSVADRVANGETVNDVHPHAAVLFMDIVGFTTMSSTMDPNDVVLMLRNIFTTCDAIMAQHNLMKIKTIGDSYMAVALPSADADGDDEQQRDIAERTARAALQLLHEVSHEVSPAGSHVVSPAGLRFRIGLHLGPVVAGVIGTERLQYDVWGDTVNVASRMESNSEPGRIQVSSSFAHALKGEVVLTPRGEIEIKGKGSMTTFWLTS